MSALNIQIAGTHYKKCKIQPVEYIEQNGLGFLEGCIVKRITRWRDKDGFQDLEKIKHEVDLLIEQEQKKCAEQATEARGSIRYFSRHPAAAAGDQLAGEDKARLYDPFTKNMAGWP